MLLGAGLHPKKEMTTKKHWVDIQIEVHLASFQFSGSRKIEFHGKVAGCKLRIPIGADQIG